MNKNDKFWHYFWMMIILVGLAVPGIVRAQDATTLAVLPAAAEVELKENDTVTIHLYVTGADDLNAFDVTLTFDPAVAQLEGWDYGELLSNLYLMAVENEPGRLRVAATQFGELGVTGDGSLLILTFSGLAVGTTPLTITEAIFVPYGVGDKTYPLLEQGSLAVFRPRYNVTGEFTLQAQSQTGGIPVQLGIGQAYGMGPYTAESLDQAGQNVQFEAVVADTYLITTHQEGYLNVHEGMNVLVTVDGDTTLLPLELKGGNAVWTDNVIDISDASVVGSWYGRPLSELDESAGFNPDVNFDGQVSILDLALVAGNFGLTSEEAYDDWQP